MPWRYPPAIGIAGYPWVRLVERRFEAVRVQQCQFTLVNAMVDGAKPRLRGLATGRARLAHVRSCGGGLTCGPTRQESRPEAEKPAAAVPGGPVEGGRGYFGNR